LAWAYEEVCLYVVDFNQHGDLERWVLDNLALPIEVGKLKYYRCCTLGSWHASLAKNTAHMAACIDVTSNSAVLVNLDGDNIFTPTWLWKLLTEHGPRLVSKELTVVHYHNKMNAGTYGRLAYLKSQWMGVRGYDTAFEPMGCQDTDLKLRLANGGHHHLDIKEQWVGVSIPNVPETGDKKVDNQASLQAPTTIHLFIIYYSPGQGQATDTRIHRHMPCTPTQSPQAKVANCKTGCLRFGQMDSLNREQMRRNLHSLDTPLRNKDVTWYLDCGEPAQAGGGGLTPSSVSMASPGTPPPTSSWLQRVDAQIAHALENHPALVAESLVEPKTRSPSPAPGRGVGKVFGRVLEVSTFGAYNLCQGFKTSDAAAEMHKIVNYRQGGPPIRVPIKLAERAVRECCGLTRQKVLVFDCRNFYDPPWQETRKHIGTHRIVLDRLSEHWDFTRFFKNAFDQIMETISDLDNDTTLHLSCFCRSGEKRSVAVATILRRLCVDVLGMVAASPIRHLCSFEWPKRNCGGECEDCRHYGVHPVMVKARKAGGWSNRMIDPDDV
jgi:hypothetical protein